jgi:hypothetical protein
MRDLRVMVSIIIRISVILFRWRGGEEREINHLFVFFDVPSLLLRPSKLYNRLPKVLVGL